MNDTLKVLEKRRSCRNFKSDMIPEETLEQIVRAGTYAPTGMGKQSPIILAVTNKELRDQLSEENRKIMGAPESMDPFYGAPVILVVLANKAVNCLIGKYHKNDRCSIERVHAFWCSHDLTVFFRKLVTQFLICHCKDDWGLFSHSRWCVGSGSYDLFKCFLRNHIRFKITAASSFL